MRDHENEAEALGYRCIAGVDEAGRGPLAGPVVAAAVVLPASMDYAGLTDSKQLSLVQREHFFEEIQKSCLGFGVGVVDEETIDRINILQASLLAMKRAIEQLPVPPDMLLIDGRQKVDSSVPQKTIIKGDACSWSIAAASVLAKVTRDRIMDEYDHRYPHYEFKRHKGYGTKVHRERIREHGPCPIHRRSFKGVKEYLEYARKD